jgi:glycerol-3-phosphate O-acyltransferase/dihydroxyacetone phosphate acyltransferase
VPPPHQHDGGDPRQALGLRDHMVPTLKIEPMKVLLQFLHLVILISLSAMPTIFLNAPIALICSLYSSREQKKALAGSKVKLAARDVVLSYSIIIAIVMVPTLWVTYAVALLAASSLAARTVLVLFLCFPLASYIGVIGAEAGVVALRDLQPLFNQLRYGEAKQAELRLLRGSLQKEVRSMLKKYGPELGDIYSKRELRWDEVRE